LAWNRFSKKKSLFNIAETEWLQQHISLPVDQLCIALEKNRSVIKNKIAELEGKPVSQTTKKRNKVSIIGKRKDLGVFCRSGWEADIHRILNKLYGKEDIRYEPTTFSFAPFGVMKGTVSYTPDFYIASQDIYIEVKGWIKAQDKTKIRRFIKYFPEEAKKLMYIAGSPNTAAAKFFDSVGIKPWGYMNELKKKWKDKILEWES
jgi:hypothetical protein